MEESRRKSFRCLYERYFAVLVHFAGRHVSPDVAEDIVQDVFVEMWKSGKPFDSETAGAYLFTAVRNRCINCLQQEQVKSSFAEMTLLEIKQQGLDCTDSVEKLFIEQEELQSIYDEIELLPEKCRQIFKLSWLEDKKSHEIAELLNLSIRTVEHQLYLGLKTIRSRILRKPESSEGL
jgi:RNA polymerase sigma-70 factor (ECF subfamily)